MSRRDTAVETLAASSGKALYFWDRQSLAVASVKHRTNLSCLSWNRNNRVIAAGCEDGDIQICHNGGALMKIIKLGASPVAGIACLDWSAGSKFMATGLSTGQIYLYNLKEETPQTVIEELSEGPVTSLQYHPEDKFLAAAWERSAVKLYDFKGAMTGSLSCPDTSTKYSLQSTHAEPVLACGSAMGGVIVWDLVKQQMKEHYQKQHQAAIKAVEFIPTKPHMLYSAGEDGFLVLQDRRGDPKYANRINVGIPLSSLSVREDYASVAVGTRDGGVLLYDPRHLAEPLHRLEASTGQAVTGLHWQHCYQNLTSRARISSSKTRALAATAAATRQTHAADAAMKAPQGASATAPQTAAPGSRIPVSVAQNATAGNPTYSTMRRHSGIGTGMQQGATDYPPSSSRSPRTAVASSGNARPAVQGGSDLQPHASAGAELGVHRPANAAQYSAHGQGTQQAQRAGRSVAPSEQTPVQQTLPGLDAGLDVTPLSNMVPRRAHALQEPGQVTPVHQVQEQRFARSFKGDANQSVAAGAPTASAAGSRITPAAGATLGPSSLKPPTVLAASAADFAITPLSTMAPQHAPRQAVSQDTLAAAAQKHATPAHQAPQAGGSTLNITPLSGMQPPRPSPAHQPAGVLLDSTNQRTQQQLTSLRQVERQILQRPPLRRHSNDLGSAEHRLPSPRAAGLSSPSLAENLPSPDGSDVSMGSHRGERQRQDGAQGVVLEDSAVLSINSKLSQKQQASLRVGHNTAGVLTSDGSGEWRVKAASAQCAAAPAIAVVDEAEAANSEHSCPGSSSSLEAVPTTDASPGFSFHATDHHGHQPHGLAAASEHLHPTPDAKLGHSQISGGTPPAQQQVQRDPSGGMLVAYSEGGVGRQHGLREDILALHLDMLNQFQVQQEQMATLVHHVVERQDSLAAEVKALRKQLQSLVQTRDDLLWL